MEMGVGIVLMVDIWPGLGLVPFWCDLNE